MRIHTITVLLIIAPLSIFGQSQQRIFAPKQVVYQTAQRQAKGGSFTVQCSESDVASCFKNYLRTFKVKKENGAYIATCLGGTVTMLTSQSDEGANVDITINNASFDIGEFQKYIKTDILRGQFRKEKSTLDGMINRRAMVEAENVWLSRKNERAAAEIADRENKIQLNNTALEKYDNLIEQQKGYLAKIQSDIDQVQQEH